MAFEAGQRVTYSGRFGDGVPGLIVRRDSWLNDGGQRLARWLVHLDGIGKVHATDAMLAPVEPEPDAEKPARRRRKAEQPAGQTEMASDDPDAA